MAKVQDNIVMQGLSGTLGNQLVLKISKGRTIVSTKPTFSENRTFSAAQLAQQQAFREATTYARAVQGDEVYIAKANGSPKSPYNVAVADWFNAPEVLGIDLSGWNGAAGELVRVQARDDVKVKHVIVRFNDAEGTLLEEGSATDVGALWWEYTTKSNLTSAVTVTATAVDLPGNITELSQEKTIS